MSSIPIQRDAPRGLLYRMIRAARLDSSLYGAVREDASATGQALTVVALVVLSHGVGGIFRGMSFEEKENPVIGFLFGALGELSFFAAASGVISLFGKQVLGANATYARVLRPFGFSVVPGLLVLIASLVSLARVGAEAPVLILIGAWRLAAGYVAIRQALGLGALKSTVTLLVGVLCGMVAVVISTRVLFELLRLAGLSS